MYDLLIAPRYLDHRIWGYVSRVTSIGHGIQNCTTLICHRPYLCDLHVSVTASSGQYQAFFHSWRQGQLPLKYWQSSIRQGTVNALVHHVIDVYIEKGCHCRWKGTDQFIKPGIYHDVLRKQRSSSCIYRAYAARVRSSNSRIRFWQRKPVHKFNRYVVNGLTSNANRCESNELGDNSWTADASSYK